MKSRSTAALAATLLIGSLTLGVGATPAVASTLAAPVQVSTSASTSLLAGAQLSASDLVPSVPGARIPADTPEPATAPRGGVPIGPIINFIKSAGPSIWNACVKAAKGGWSKMVGWWNGLASWIRTGITWIANVSVQSILQSLIDWILHH